MIDFVIGVIACIFGFEVVTAIAVFLWIIWKERRK